MKKLPISEKLLLEEVTQVGLEVLSKMRGLSIVEFIRLILINLGMSQSVLAKRAGVPQATISRIEKRKNDPKLSTLEKILNALSCDLILLPILRESSDIQRRKQARKMAIKHIKYLQGTMNLENQECDSRMVEALTKHAEEDLLHNPSSKLWEE